MGSLFILYYTNNNLFVWNLCFRIKSKKGVLPGGCRCRTLYTTSKCYLTPPPYIPFANMHLNNHKEMTFHRILLLLLLLLLHMPQSPAAAGGSWSLLLPSIGISAMHMQLLPTDRVVIYDRTDFGTSNISLPDGKCRPNSTDCSAHSVEYNIACNTVRPLMVLSNVWCSSGTLMPDGSLVQTGGWSDGDHVVRIYKSCGNCDWREIPTGLSQPRWYATNHLLPDGRQIIVGGRRSFNYEFYPKTSATETDFTLMFLVQTNEPDVENNLYPFVFLNTDGNIFIYANYRGILFDYVRSKVVRTFPAIPGGDPRNYPSTGSAVLLPLHIVQGNVDCVEVLVCGGAPRDAFKNANNGKFDGALDTCGRIKISDPDPQWVMETMPLARVMGDMVLLPNGDVLIINGGSAGVAGWDLARDPVLSPVIYGPDKPTKSRFEVQTPSTIARMYHSTAILLRDGRVLVGGSNAHDKYEFTNVLYPTELSLEAFSPAYLDPSLSGLRPNIISHETKTTIHHGENFVIRFIVSCPVDPNLVKVTMVAPSFNTHSFSMNQRLLILDGGNTTVAVGMSHYEVSVVAPPSGNIAPAGNYILFVVHQEVPSEGIWVSIR
ncbi:putative galactose oxidase [Helianthus annuus]|nr:putative galactose oxidase [Helianthus annuus]